MTSARHSVERTFRHEYGRLVSLLTQRFGVQHIDAIEDAVQGAMERALNAWGRRGIPSQPAAWLYRVAQNILIDRVRRQLRERGALERSVPSGSNHFESLAAANEPTIADLPDAIQDTTLKLLFLCCHPELPLESRVAFALKVVSGFSTNELAASFLISHANAEKRIARAKEKLRAYGTELTDLTPEDLASRLESVLATLYLLFNEGYSASQGDRDLRDDLCDEAIRLTRMLTDSPITALPSAHALLALMLLHRARLDARQGHDGSVIPLEEQDRSRWDWALIREAMQWMQRSATGDALSRYHLESAIAWEHCRAASLADVDWSRIDSFYEHLHAIAPTQMIKLNWSIANAYSHGPERGLAELVSMNASDRARIRPWWDCAVAQVYQLLGDQQASIAHWSDALALAATTAQRDLIQRRILECQTEPR